MLSAVVCRTIYFFTSKLFPIAAITIYTDGSCHTQSKKGAWAAIVLAGKEKSVLQGKAVDTTHQRMELMAVIEALKFVQASLPANSSIHLITDSQYVTGLPGRQQKLSSANFITRQGKRLQNEDMINQLYLLLAHLDVRIEKVKAHQKSTGEDNYNIEVDKLSRKLVREGVL